MMWSLIEICEDAKVGKFLETRLQVYFVSQLSVDNEGLLGGGFCETGT